MKKILFIYSLIISVSLALFFAFSNPSRTTLIISLLMLPIPAYFFISLTNPRETSVPKWSFRVLLIIFLLSLLGIISLKLLAAVPVQKEIKIEDESPAPTMMEEKRTKGSGDFTDILIEESKND